MPSTLGIRMSITTTSGVVCAAIATASAPSLASATTVIPASASASRRTPRSNALSSAIKIRIGSDTRGHPMSVAEGAQPASVCCPAVASFRFVQCDVFTDRPLTGNALAVFTNAGGLDDATMAAIARETNLSETTFVLPPQSGGDFRVRIFTPGAELPLAGHPLIGTAVVLGRAVPVDRLVFETGVGPITL